MNLARAKIFFCLSIILFLCACNVAHKRTESGVRVNNPDKAFKYKKAKYGPQDRAGIDTAVVYVKRHINHPWDKETPKKEVCCDFMRFFPTGQVILVHTYVDNAPEPRAQQVNDRDIGMPGYFITKGNKLIIEVFEYCDSCTRIGHYFGRIQPDGSLIMYEQVSATYFDSYFLMELLEKDNNSNWEKLPIEGFEAYTPDW